MNQSRIHNSNHAPHHHHHHSSVLSNNSMLNTARHDIHNENKHYSMMSMSFHSGFIETILFEQWTTTSIPIFISSCLFVYVLGILYEGIRELRQYLGEEQLTQEPITLDDGNENELQSLNTELPAPTIEAEKKVSPRHTKHTLQSILYTFQLGLSYILMLIAMTFNIYLFFAIIFGIGTGHLVYAWNRIPPTINTNPRRI